MTGLVVLGSIKLGAWVLVHLLVVLEQLKRGLS